MTIIDEMSPTHNIEHLILLSINNDNLAKLIIRLKLSPFGVGVIAFTLSLLSSLVISFITRATLPNSAFPTPLEDRLYLFFVIALVPLIWVFYAWMCRGPIQVLDQLYRSQNVQLEEMDLDTQLKIRKKVSPLLTSFLLGSLTSCLVLLRGISASPNWLNMNSTYFAVYTLLIIAPTAIVAWLTLIKFIYNAQFYNRVLREIVVYPLHPDKAGGLGSLGRYAFITSLPFAIGGCIAVLFGYPLYLQGELATAYHIQAAFVIYIVLTPLFFLMPLFTTHSSMLRLKETFIDIVSSQSDIGYELASRGLTGSSSSLSVQLERIRNMKKLGQWVDQYYPIWPFSPNTKLRFLLAFSAPILLLAILVVVELIWKP